MAMTAYQDIIYDVERGAATITINRPEKMNAFRPQTCSELIDAFLKAGWDKDIAVIVLTGVGERAFCTGGDQSDHVGQYGDGTTRGTIGMPVEELHSVIRDVPKPVIAKVRGYAIGGGNVLATLCDMTIAAENAIFGQVGPRMGSVDPGFGTAYLARVVGEKKAREIWYMCRRYTAQEAVAMGLANKAVPNDQLDAEVRAWCDELILRSPTAITIAKRSFNADSENIRGIGALGMQALNLYYASDESKEGVTALGERRTPDFRKVMGLTSYVEEKKQS
jgi:2-ketocyclohexanecarboxyl-CoA hydrolase